MEFFCVFATLMDNRRMSLRALCLALLLPAFLAAPTADAKPRRRAMSTLRHIVIDAGHGGHNLGTPGAHGVHEKYVTLPIAKQLAALLKNHTNAKVTMTRTADEFVGLRERTRMANAANGDVLLSIHCNASPNPMARGLEVYFLSAGSASEEIARLVGWEDGAAPSKAAGAPARTKAPSTLDKIIQDAKMHRAHERAEVLAEVILDELHVTLRAPRRGVMQAPFAVLKEAEMPAIVVEVGFLSHAEEGRRLLTADYQKRVAVGLYRALVALDKRMKRR